MRTVVRVQLTTGVNPDVAFDAAVSNVELWSNNKFATDHSGNTYIKGSDKRAIHDTRQDILDAGSGRLYSLQTMESVSEGDLHVIAKAVRIDNVAHFRCEIGLDSPQGIAPVEATVRLPKFVREIVQAGEWFAGIGADRVFNRSFNVAPKDVQTLLILMTSAQRRLPLVLVSEYEGDTFADDLQERLSRDLCGVAHVCRITEEASWALTREEGREWSSYNGAVRLFWPFRSNRGDFRTHPLWTRDQIMRDAYSIADARERFRQKIIARVFEATTFSAETGHVQRFLVAQTRQIEDTVRVNARSDSDFESLATLYAEENDNLRLRVDEQQSIIQTLQDNIESLTIALRSSESTSASDNKLLDESPPVTVAEAVDQSRIAVGKRVSFPDDLASQISTLNVSAGPPEKIRRYLLTLGKLADALRSGSLGKALPIWLRDEGVECSGESETVKGSKSEMEARTWSSAGQRVECEFHLKPSDGTSPDMCARIYFATNTVAPHVRIGYVGRHF